MAKEKGLWVAVVVAKQDETGRVLASFLTVHAVNRFKAQLEVKKQLPENPAYLTGAGELRPFRFVELRQVQEKQLPAYQGAFFEMFGNMFGGSEHDIHTHSA